MNRGESETKIYEIFQNDGFVSAVKYAKNQLKSECLKECVDFVEKITGYKLGQGE